MSATDFSPAARSYLDSHAIAAGFAASIGIVEDRDELVYPNGRRRSLNGAGPKVRQPKGQPLTPWTLIAGEGTAIIGEGETDSLAAASALPNMPPLAAGDPGVIAVPGTGCPIGRVVEAAQAQNATEAYIASDGDDAGHKFAEKLAEALWEAEIKPLRVSLPDGTDLSDLLAAVEPAERGARLRELLENAADMTPSAPSEGLPTPRPDTAELLAEIEEFIRRYVFLGDAQAAVIALWIAHTYALEASRVTPYLSVTSAEPGSGKTLLLEVLAMLVPKPWLTGRTSAAVLPRKIEAVQPTLLLDESDNAFGGDKDYATALNGILASGYKRSGNSTLCVGQGANIDFRDFATFCPKAFAGLGQHLPDNIASRSLPIRLLKIADEPVEEFEEEEVEADAATLRDQLAAFAATAADLKGAKPQRPNGFNPRQKEITKPLLAIAELAGGEWPENARNALLELLTERAKSEEPSLGVQLLADIRAAFDGGEEDALPTVVLLSRLKADEESPWSAWGRGDSGLTAVQLGRFLRPYEIRSADIHVHAEGKRRTVKGYRRETFSDAWKRHLSPASGVLSRATRAIGSTEPKTEGSQPAPEPDLARLKTPRKRLQQAIGAGGAFQTPLLEQEAPQVTRGGCPSHPDGPVEGCRYCAKPAGAELEAVAA